ncbi:cytochrome c biogenesis CcdA family protein [Saccharopolyspora griseoalba]|uniref:Cytochrome c biogenesis CcdA family protein n=1 Tax=Saccharopolyspora griseoalba TaxID=1431848 RepID=A0ABW2LE91_9PSEU
MELFGLASLATVAGLVSFSSPCVLPLLPGYISYVSGLSQPDATPDRRRAALGAGLFVLGFSAVFTALGVTSSLLGLLLARHQLVIDKASGALILLMAASMLGLQRIPGLNRQARFDLGRISRGPAGAPLLGAAFGFGWTPCVGPVLASILSTAANTTTATRGALLLLAYSAGLGVPFVLLATGLSRGKDRFGWLRRHARRIEIAGGLLLAVMGLAVMTGDWTALMSRMLAFYARIGWPPL